jgi:cysteine desulfuration protein SufE
MPEPLKTDATLVRGCSAAVWVYPTALPDGRLHFLADSNAGITKGIIALVLLTVQDRTPKEIVATDIESALAPFDLGRQLSSNRTQGIPNMIGLIRQTAERLAA